MLRFEATLAFRHLRSGGGQTALTVSAVAAGVILVVFITSLIYGVQKRIAELLTDILPNVTVTSREVQPKGLGEYDPSPRPPPRNGEGESRRTTPSSPLSVSGRGVVTPADEGRREQGAEGSSSSPIVSSRIERLSPQRKAIENWPQAAAVIRNLPGVTAVAPAVMGQGFASRGGRRFGCQVYGAHPVELDAVTSVTKYLFTGHYEGLDGEEIVIGYKLSQDLGVGVGDRIRLTSSEGLSDSFLVAGIFDTGQQQTFTANVYVTLRSGQSLFALGTGVHSILVRTSSIFDADRIAERIAALLPYKAESWSQQAPQTVAGLKAQNAVASLISGFSLIASAFAIASVLIVSVLQKSKQIGILKSMGAKSRQILLVFTLEGLGIALVGATLGAISGSLLVWGLSFIKQPVTRMGAKPEPLFMSMLSWQLIAGAMLAAIVSTVLAAILPARRAAKLDPVQVMR
jgi:lipoprotein-releasing system permease protein